ncbi:ABC transporter ATP-binding protein [Halomonas maura]|uniref:ABC transporter ATP-binding protein n=1 Tax=Halomonas maura TaxID=117606 RepID=UPI0025B5D3CD|nr:ABC transporter ATP-binding protein [Halomonas maura]MDN3555233.1 ABC transporter ATP-binding protein [Halomonas maura]
MFASLKELYKLLTRMQRTKLFRLQFFVVLMAFAEIGSVLAIGPFMAIVGNMQQLQGDGRLAQLYQFSGFEKPEQFLFWIGLGVLCILTGAAMISIYTSWRLSMYGSRIGAELSCRLYKHYMYQPWLFHSSGNSSQLTNQISQECLRVTNGVIRPVLQMNAKIIMASFMAIAIFVYNPLVALAGITIFSIAYVLLYFTVRFWLVNNGKTISTVQRQRFKLMNEGFGGIKDSLLLGRQPVFTDQFDKASERYAQAQGITQALTQVPRYALELVAFGAVIFLVLYLLTVHQGNLGTILPILSVYALAGFKLLPAFQQIYANASQIRANLAAFETIIDDLHASREMAGTKIRVGVEAIERTAEVLSPRQAIQLKDIVFRYPGKETSALKGLTLEIPVNKVIGLVGASGSGKSTAIDLMLGLIEPNQGQVLIDGQPLTAGNRRAWQNCLGFVPQSIFLADSSIRENIAFGLPLETIEDQHVRRAASMARLDELLAQLPDGLETQIGERGVQLSGGQRQRIGIARALYHDADVLVLDEATSALDGITEKLIMDAIHDFSGKKTIVMIAHRLTTVKQCDCIYLLADGQVADQGRYSELVSHNVIFQRMADHA